MSWVNEFLLHAHNWWNGVSKVKTALKKNDATLRLGVLGAANINFNAIIDPIQTHPGVTLAAIAARDSVKAKAQIEKFGLTSTKAYGSYDELLNDPNIDAIYIPLPNGLHYEWAVKSIQAGKHVLIEKPITSNAEQMRKLLQTAKPSGKVVLEAFHWRFHPASHTVKELIESGKYGNVRSISTKMNLPSGIVGSSDIRLRYDLAGGACMDLTYVFSASCYFSSPDITQASFNVLEATPRLNRKDKQVDEAMNAIFQIEQPNKPVVTCKVECDLVQPPFLGFIPRLWEDSMCTTIDLDKAQIHFSGFVVPWLNHKISITEKDDQGILTNKKSIPNTYVNGPIWGQRGASWWTTYRYQLEGFTDMIKARSGSDPYNGPWMSLEESTRLLELIDMVYDKAGLSRRGL